MSIRSGLAVAAVVLAASGCTGYEAVLGGGSVSAAGAAVDPPVLRGLDGVPGWKRTGPPERYRKDGLYGYIDGGAEIVLQYGFRELSVSRYKPASDAAPARETSLEIYRMTSAEAAFGLYSTKLEGGEKGWPGLKPDNWVGQGQASLVKGEYLVNVLAPDCGEKELGEFLAAVERKVPGRGTSRPKELAWLPPQGLIPSSWHVIKGPLAAQNESPFLEGDFWKFDADAGRRDATTAFSAKYGAPPAVFKLVVARLGPECRSADIDAGVLAMFKESLRNVRQANGLLEGQNEVGRWFLFGRDGSRVALALGGSEEAEARNRLEAALSRGRR